MAVRRRPPGRRTNLALLGLLTLALVSGVLGYATGTPGRSVLVTAVHDVAGLGMLTLVPWKRLDGPARTGPAAACRPGRTGPAAAAPDRAVVRDRPDRAGPAVDRRGMAHAWAGDRAYLGVTALQVTALQVHVGAALVALPSLVHHVWVRPQWVRRTDLSRRTLLGAATLTGAAAAVYLAASGTAVLLRLPGRDRRAPARTPRAAATRTRCR